MSSANNSNGNAPKDTSNDTDKTPKDDTTKHSPTKAKQTTMDNPPDGRRIPFDVQIGAVSTYGDVISGKAPFKPQHTMESPTIKELYARVRAEFQKPGPTEPGPVHEGTPVQAIRLPNNGCPEGTCAGCGAEDGERGGALRQCARCKGRKYCGRACQKGDWPKHRPGCVES